MSNKGTFKPINAMHYFIYGCIPNGLRYKVYIRYRSSSYLLEQRIIFYFKFTKCCALGI